MTATEHLTDTLMASLDLHASLQQALADMGFSHCTPIQALTLPQALQGHDVAGQAQTGTGKSAAFLLATFHRLLSNPQPEASGTDQPSRPRALILAPTRELAIQIHKDAVAIGAHTGLRLSLAYGGTGYDTQRDAIAEGCDILIGTPGRLIDYFKQRVFDLKGIEVVVLDEADRMFDLGFISDIRYLLRRMPTPEQRLNMLFSATLSHRVLELAYEHMNDPQLLKVEADTMTADRVTQLLYHVANEDKIPLLLGLLRDLKPERGLVFINTKREGERLSDTLQANGWNAEILSGDVRQQKRSRLLQQFQSGELPLLVATDVAARGLHIPEVSHVFNYDLPQDPEDYVHRIGRTARAGAEGDAVSLCCETYVYSLPDIEKYIGHKLPSEPVNDAQLVRDYTRAPRRERKPRHAKGGGGGNRSGRRRSQGARR
ncbi:MAG: DEAD/DEAH box helicase [Nevskiales bacterium]